MAANKTQANNANVIEFLHSVENETRKNDAFTLLDMFSAITGEQAVMWGNSIVGFGQFEYTNTKGQQPWMLTGFSPRKQNMTLYIMQGFAHYQQDLALIGKVKTAKSCLYINKLADINIEQLKLFLTKVVTDMRAKYPK